MNDKQREKAGGALVGVLIAGIITGSIFMARSMHSDIRGIRDEIATLNRDLGQKLDLIIEFRGIARTKLEEHDKRIYRVESILSRASVR